MSIRYEQLFRLPADLYHCGAPVVVSAGALLQDKETGGLLAQLKFRNIQDKAIVALTVALILHDITGEVMNDTVTYQYLDVLVGRDQSFGENVPIVIENRAARSYEVQVRAVVYANNTVWQGTDEGWTPLAPALSLQEAFCAPHLEREYVLSLAKPNASPVTCVYTTVEDLWYCVCGLLNHDDEAHCHSCGRARETMATLDRPTLEARAAERQAAEARLKEEAAQEAAKRHEEKIKARAESLKKAKRIGKKAAIIAIPLIIIGAIAGKFIYDYFQDQAEYEQDLQNYAFAQTLMDRKDYEAAERQFKSLGDFQDSAKKAEEAGKRADEQKYNDAVKALNGGRSADAYEAFSALKDYKDSEKLKDTASLQNRLDTFPSSRSYFVANKDDYPLVGVDEGAMVLLGTWIYCAPTAGEHWRLTLNADGSGSETELDIRWAFDAQGFRYTYGSDDALLDVSDELGNELRKITDGVYGIFFKDDSDEMALLISTGSDWGKRYEAAYEFYY